MRAEARPRAAKRHCRRHGPTAAAGDGLIPLWAGEGDLPTPPSSPTPPPRRCATARLSTPGRGASPNCGRRSPAITRRHFGQSFRARKNSSSPAPACRRSSWRLQAIAGSGRRGDLPVAGLAEFRRRRRGRRRQCRFRSPLDQSGNGWSCDVDKIAAADHAAAHARIFVNSPSNPTGWTADIATLQAILDLARATTSGSSPTRSMRCSTMTAWPRAVLPRYHGDRRTASCSSTPSPRTGR